MKDLRQFFSYLNDVNFPYVVLRNWDGLPYNVELGQHSDLDLLVYDLDHFLEVIDEAEAQFELPRVRYKLPIGDSHIFMDLRHIGDNYYPKDFQNAIINTREFNKNGFFTPNPIHHRIALAYHAVHHKGFIANDYVRHLGDTTLDELFQALKASNVGWVEPNDPTVGRYNAYWKGATGVVSIDGDIVRKSQINFLDYPLLENEKQVLNHMNSIHFPRVKGMLVENGKPHHIEVEHCGEPLDVGNLPYDWKDQCKQIIKDLETNGVVHRDIKPDNLMVKDGVLKLIDFGWAVNDKTCGVIRDEAPNCLGYPFRSSEGFSDAFSMNKVIKHFDYKLEEKEEANK